MIKTVSIFRVISSAGADWPDALVQRFSSNFSRGVFSFIADSEDETGFRDVAEEYDLQISRSKVLKVTSGDLYEFPFHYLTVGEDRYYDKGAFWDPSSGCHGGSSFRCGVGAVQIEKLTIDEKRSKTTDVMTDAGWPHPFIYLVSRRLRNLLAGSNFSGFRLVPCLRSGSRYCSQERSIDFSNERLEKEATHFQLIVAGRALGVPSVGKVLRVFSECPACHRIHGAFFESFPRFRRESLASEDFQLVSEYESTNRGRFGIRGELLIVSKRVLRFFRDHKMSGLSAYLTDPRIPHGVVEITSD